LANPTIGRLRELISAMPDEALILAIGVTKQDEIKLVTCKPGEEHLFEIPKNVKWMQRVNG